jgi:hypothetical protein
VEIVAEVRLHLPESEGAQAAKTAMLDSLRIPLFVEAIREFDALGVKVATLSNVAASLSRACAAKGREPSTAHGQWPFHWNGDRKSARDWN